MIDSAQWRHIVWLRAKKCIHQRITRLKLKLTLAAVLQYLDSFSHITKQQSGLKLSTQVLAYFSYITSTLSSIDCIFQCKPIIL